MSDRGSGLQTKVPDDSELGWFGTGGSRVLHRHRQYGYQQPVFIDLCRVWHGLYLSLKNLYICAALSGLGSGAILILCRTIIALVTTKHMEPRCRAWSGWFGGIARSSMQEMPGYIPTIVDTHVNHPWRQPVHATNSNFLIRTKISLFPKVQCDRAVDWDWVCKQELTEPENRRDSEPGPIVRLTSNQPDHTPRQHWPWDWPRDRLQLSYRAPVWHFD